MAVDPLQIRLAEAMAARREADARLRTIYDLLDALVFHLGEGHVSKAEDLIGEMKALSGNARCSRDPRSSKASSG